MRSAHICYVLYEPSSQRYFSRVDRTGRFCTAWSLAGAKTFLEQRQADNQAMAASVLEKRCFVTLSVAPTGSLISSDSYPWQK